MQAVYIPLIPKDAMSGAPAAAQAFAQSLREEFTLTVQLWDERLTTAEAHRHLDALRHSRAPNSEGVDGRKSSASWRRC